MCLGEVCEVTEVRPGGRAFVRGPQRVQEVLLLTLSDDVAVGDWLVCHSGFALGRISEDEAADAQNIRTTRTTEVSS